MVIHCNTCERNQSKTCKIYKLFEKRTGVYYQVSKLEAKPRVLKTRKTKTASILNGFKIFDTVQLILALIFRFGVILV